MPVTVLSVARNENFNAKLRDEPPKRGIFYTLQEAQVPIERSRREYNHGRLPRLLGDRPPAPEMYWVPN